MTRPLPKDPDHRPVEMVVISFLTRFSTRDGSGFSLTATRKSNSSVGMGNVTDGLGKWCSARLQDSSTLLVDGMGVSGHVLFFTRLLWPPLHMQTYLPQPLSEASSWYSCCPARLAGHGIPPTGPAPPMHPGTSMRRSGAMLVSQSTDSSSSRRRLRPGRQAVGAVTSVGAVVVGIDSVSVSVAI